MSIALDTIHADLTRELRADLAATRNALERSQEANEALRRQVERLKKAVMLLSAEGTAYKFRIETIAREVL